MRYEHGEGKLRAACELPMKLRFCRILLSAGVTYEEFAMQVKITCQVGASGFLGGHAIWEAMHIPKTRERREWLTAVGRDRMHRLYEIDGKYEQPVGRSGQIRLRN